MALDGAFLSHLRREIITYAEGARVDKIYQPSKDELILFLRGKGFSGRLLLSVNGIGPRIHFTEFSPENPAVPPMFCMLARKYFVGAKLKNISQPGLERVVRLEFDAISELGDAVTRYIIIEIMGRQSNIILADQSERIIDAVKRVDIESTTRLILPGARYELPAPQEKLNLTQVSSEDVLVRLGEAPDAELSKALMGVLDGASPIVCRELAFSASKGAEKRLTELTPDDMQRLKLALDRLRLAMESGTPVMVSDRNGKPIDFTYIDVSQYGMAAVTKKKESYSTLLDSFYAERQHNEHMRRRAQDLLKLLSNLTERTARKLEKQRSDLKKCADREKLRIYGELLKANLHTVQKGASFCDVQNYYDPDGKTLRLPLNSALSPSQNAQKFFKDYRKSYTAEQMLTRLIGQGEQELTYFESVFDALSRAESERELAEIREELQSGGYIRLPHTKAKKSPKALPPLTFQSDDGFIIYVGRNNRQNDELTLKRAAKSDIWLHTKGIHGAHTIIAANGGDVPESTLIQAAMLAAYHSKARDSQNVPVDYIAVKNVKKPQGAKPGMVIYDNYRTVYVTPEKELAARLSV